MGGPLLTTVFFSLLHLHCHQQNERDMQRPPCYYFTCPEVKLYLLVRHILWSSISMHKLAFLFIPYFRMPSTRKIYWWHNSFDILYIKFAMYASSCVTWLNSTRFVVLRCVHYLGQESVIVLFFIARRYTAIRHETSRRMLQDALCRNLTRKRHLLESTVLAQKKGGKKEGASFCLDCFNARHMLVYHF